MAYKNPMAWYPGASPVGGELWSSQAKEGERRCQTMVVSFSKSPTSKVPETNLVVRAQLSVNLISNPDKKETRCPSSSTNSVLLDRRATCRFITQPPWRPQPNCALSLVQRSA